MVSFHLEVKLKGGSWISSTPGSTLQFPAHLEVVRCNSSEACTRIRPDSLGGGQ